ncbi:MAG: hypothetical protein KA371_06305 [Acidobacteria bacterium]|nr:hypothetical protein [Acidobacteriota bacterium]
MVQRPVPAGDSTIWGQVRPRTTRELLARSRLVEFLERQTGKRFDPQLRSGRPSSVGIAWMRVI